MVKRKSDEVEAPSYEIFGSPIHGQGARAARPIPKGAYIIEYTGERISKEESERRGLERMAEAEKDGGGAVYIFELDDDWDLDGNQPDNDARLFNHSCDPNCETENDEGRIWVIALREIEPGEELTFDYGYGIETFLDHPCVCGSDNCVGYIVGAAYRKKLKRKLAGKLGSKSKQKRKNKKEGTAKEKEKPAKGTKEKGKGKGKAKGKGKGSGKAKGGGASGGASRRRERVA